MSTLALALALTGPLAAQSNDNRPGAKVVVDYKDSIPIWMSRSQVPGLALAVLEHRKVTVLEPFGEAHKGARVSLNTLFNVASLTKPVVAVTTLRLVSAGKLDLDESLAPYWIDPDIRDDSLYKKITTRIILSHQTGFPNWRSLSPTGKLGFLFAPGARYKYSGEGFEYLRHALERKFGRRLQQLSDSILFQPLGMSETTYGWNPRMDSLRFAVGHDTNGVALIAEKHSTATPNAADWLVTTIGDYSRFAEYVLNGAGLSTAVFARMTTPQVQFEGKPNEAMGLGWEVMTGPPGDERILLHTGSDPGIKTLIVLLPASGRGLVVFTNGERGMDVMLQIVKASLRIKELTP